MAALGVIIKLLNTHKVCHRTIISQSVTVGSTDKLHHCISDLHFVRWSWQHVVVQFAAMLSETCRTVLPTSADPARRRFFYTPFSHCEHQRPVWKSKREDWEDDPAVRSLDQWSPQVCTLAPRWTIKHQARQSSSPSITAYSLRCTDWGLSWVVYLTATWSLCKNLHDFVCVSLNN